MSDTNDTNANLHLAPAAAGAHGEGRDHVPHVLPLSMYIGTWLVLVVATAITVGASYVNFGSWNVLIALGIATIKASVVGALFMHLRWDHKFHTIVFTFSLVFLGVFIAFTMYDTETRGRTDAKEGDRPASVTMPFKQGKQELELKAKYDHDVPPPKEPPR